MIAIIQAKINLFIRKPWLFLLMMGISIMFAFLIGRGSAPIIHVPVYSELIQSETDQIMEELQNKPISSSISSTFFNNAFPFKR